jgi:hypothetical protein
VFSLLDMDIKTSKFPVLALNRELLAVLGSYESVVHCYRGLLSSTYQGTTYIDGVGISWRCRGAKVIKSLIPFWKKPFTADLVQVELDLDGIEMVLDIKECKKLLVDCVSHACSFVVDTGKSVYETKKNPKVLKLIQECIERANTIHEMIGGIETIIIKNG